MAKSNSHKSDVAEQTDNGAAQKRAQWPKVENRRAFTAYCRATEHGMRQRAGAGGFPCELTWEDLDRLFVDQRWRCKVSGIPFDPPRSPTERRGPFAPSVDRIEPSKGYVAGNVRLVSNIVNQAMSDWGAEPLVKLAMYIALKENTRRNAVLAA